MQCLSASIVATEHNRWFVTVLEILISIGNQKYNLYQSGSHNILDSLYE